MPARLFLLTVASLGALVLSASSALAAGGRWYVKADAPAGGVGSQQRPFNSLAAVESASSAGDKIYVLPASRVLDGGITLKPAQSLMGAGPSVTKTPDDGESPMVTNTTAARYGGDAIVMAEKSTIENIRVLDAYRHAILANELSEVTIVGNLIERHNASNTAVCRPDVLNLESACLPYGAEGIDIEATQSKRYVAWIRNNVVTGGNGIGIGAHTDGSADLTFNADRNRVTGLRQFPFDPAALPPGSTVTNRAVNGLQFWSSGSSRMLIRLTDLFISDIGESTTNNDGFITFHEGQSKVRYELERYVYRNPLKEGNRSASGIEFFFPQPTKIGPGVQPGLDFDLSVKDSDFRDSNGSGIQVIPWGSGGHFAVKVRDSLFANAGFSPAPTTVTNRGAGFEVSSRGDSTWDLDFQDTKLVGNNNDGIVIGNDVGVPVRRLLDGNIPSLKLTLRDSTLKENGVDALRIDNRATIQNLLVQATCSEFAGSPTGLAFVNSPGQTGNSMIDLGGGPAGSSGGNRIVGNTVAALLDDYAVKAERNWWGSPFGPDPATIQLVGSGFLDYTPFLTRDPRGCDGR